MPVSRTEYSTRFELPDLLQRDQGGTLTCPVERSNALVAPSAGTLTLRRSDGTKIIDAQAATITGDMAQYAVAAGTIASEPYGMGLQAEWSLTLAGSARTFRNEVGIVRVVPTCPVTQGMLEARRTGITRDLPGTGETTLQKWIDEAWKQFNRWLIAQGNRPQLLLYPHEMVEIVTVWAMRVYYADLARNAQRDGQRAKDAEDLRVELEALKGSAHFAYSKADDVVADPKKRAGQPITTLASHGYPEYGRGYGFDPDRWGY
jgi:hypothetical protein